MEIQRSFASLELGHQFVLGLKNYLDVTKSEIEFDSPNWKVKVTFT